MPHAYPPGTLENFFTKVEKTDTCWLWLGGLSPRGYGRYYEGKTEDGRAKITTAHRWVYEQVVGGIPEGLVLDHLCRVRRCVRPDHLDPVSIGENTRRGFDSRGFDRKGTSKHALVTEEDFTRWTLKTAKHIIVVKDKECWNWKGSTDPDGYGRINVPQEGGTYKTVRAHRWFYATFVGEIPKDHVLDHLCSNRICVNPDHLEPLTHAEHISRSWERKRAEKKICANGHDLTEVGFTKNGRDCKQCNRDKVSRFRAKKLAEDPEAYRAAHAAAERERRVIRKAAKA